MSENLRRVRQARNFTTNVPKILDLKSSSEQIFFRKLSLGAPESACACEKPLSTCVTYYFKASLVSTNNLSRMIVVFWNLTRSIICYLYCLARSGLKSCSCEIFVGYLLSYTRCSLGLNLYIGAKFRVHYLLCQRCIKDLRVVQYSDKFLQGIVMYCIFFTLQSCTKAQQ